MPRHRFFLSMLIVSAAAIASETNQKNSVPKTVDFNHDVRPIISANCFACHGNDPKSRKAKLRLDTREGAIADLDGTSAIVPGSPEKSELIKRITSKNSDEVMPPAKSGHKLSEYQVQVLKKWIQQNAPYAEHWSFVAPQRPALPKVKSGNWPQNGIDNFILAKQKEEGVSPSQPADRYALIRRVSLDLTGLPPKPEDVDAFVKDKSSNAYEKVVDRLLESPAFGERWARMWLDLARYADSAGYGSDPLRLNIWPYRDWVISAFNRNLPYDQFILQQVAGDLLPNPTQDMLLATAFNRNTMTNTEGGTDDEEFRIAAVKDRINTTMQVCMGLTMGCAQCHSHKFDPISQKEYYQAFAIFNQTEDTDQPNEVPTMPIETPTELAKNAELKAKIAEIEKQINQDSPQFLKELAEWEQHNSKPVEWVPLEISEFKSSGGAGFAKQSDHSILVKGNSNAKDSYTVRVPTKLNNITALRLEVLPDASLPNGGVGRSEGGNFVLNEFRASVLPTGAGRLRGKYVRIENPGASKYLHLAEVQAFSNGQNVALKGKAKQSSTDYEGPAERGIDGNTEGDYTKHKTTHTKEEKDPWWEVDLHQAFELDQIVVWNRTDGGSHARLTNFIVTILDAEHKTVWQKTIAESPNPNVKLEVGGARTIVLKNASADHSQEKFPVQSAIDAKSDAKIGWAVGPHLNKPHTAIFEAEKAVDTGGNATLIFAFEQNYGDKHALGRFRLSATTQKPPVRVIPENIAEIFKVKPAQRSDKQKAELAAHFRSQAPSTAKLRDEIAKFNDQLSKIKPTAVPVMRELPAAKHRKSKILVKGNFLTPGDPVEAAIPASFNPLPEGSKPDRLGLAKWLVDRKNPLTARVAVNRFWAQIFGAGIVETEEDFGTQGALPTHPELLDWMAVEFMERGWDTKAFLKMVVTSAVYQQSSKTVASKGSEKDPRNRLLWRFPRQRIDAEMVRDSAMALSGLLSPKIGGPSVYPPQPDGLWRAAFNGERTWATSKGEDRYRRGMYTFWRRTVPYPSMATFDAPSRETCTVRRISTNTPLQAFVTLNDPAYVEAAQALGRRIVREGGKTVEERARYGLKLCLARVPSNEQVRALVTLYEEEFKHYSAKADDAKKMATEPIGPLPPEMTAAEQAAWTVVGNVLLNLDGVLTKG